MSDETVENEFDLHEGQVVRLGSTGSFIRFDRVVNDDRCPIDVVCVWEGNASLVMQLSPDRRKWQVVELNTRLQPDVIHIDEYALKILELKPRLRSTDPPPNSYRVTLQLHTP